MPYADPERKREYDRERMRRLRLREPERVEVARARWRQKKLDEGLCTNCGKEIWLRSDRFDRARCWDCVGRKELAEAVAAYEAMFGSEPEPNLDLRPLRVECASVSSSQERFPAVSEEAERPQIPHSQAAESRWAPLAPA
jgi:hypothetical protein